MHVARVCAHVPLSLFVRARSYAGRRVHAVRGCVLVRSQMHLGLNPAPRLHA